MAEDEELVRRMVVGGLMRESWEADPPDESEWVRALQGCAQLYLKAAQHLEGENYPEAVRCLRTALETGADLVPQISMAYVMSGKAMGDFMENIRESLANYEGEHEQRRPFSRGEDPSQQGPFRTED